MGFLCVPYSDLFPVLINIPPQARLYLPPTINRSLGQDSCPSALSVFFKLLQAIWIMDFLTDS